MKKLFILLAFILCAAWMFPPDAQFITRLPDRKLIQFNWVNAPGYAHGDIIYVLRFDDSLTKAKRIKTVTGNGSVIIPLFDFKGVFVTGHTITVRILAMRADGQEYSPLSDPVTFIIQ